MSAAEATGTLQPKAANRQLVNGKHIHFRFAQSFIWSTVAGFLGAGFIAGLYFGGLQVDWHVWIGPVHFQIFDLKNWWDGTGGWHGGMGFIRSGNWPDYRHGAFRDLAEPAVATMAVRTLLAPAKYWDTRVGVFRLVTAPLVVLALTFGLGVAGIWLLDFGGPNAWAHIFTLAGHPGYKLHAAFLGKASIGRLLLGVAIGQVLHRYWAPVGATLQGYLIDRGVDRAQASGRIPLWETYPLMAPVVRERFAAMYRQNTSITLPRGTHRRVLAGIIAFGALVIILGLIGHYWVGVLGHHVPYLAP